MNSVPVIPTYDLIKIDNRSINSKQHHCRRLVARTLPFQGGEAGSIPVDSTNQQTHFRQQAEVTMSIRVNVFFNWGQ